MDQLQLQVSSSLILSCIVLLIFTILIALKMAKTSKSKPNNLPPGPWKLPFIGNLHQMIGSLPHHKMRDLAKKHGPLMHMQLGEISTLIVSSSEIAQQVMKKHDLNFAYRPSMLFAEIITYGSTNIVFAPYGDYWRQLRRICTLELLSTRRVQSFRSVREEEMLNLVDWISLNAGSPVNLSEKVLSLGYATISRAVFGNKTIEHDRFNLLAKEIINLGAGFFVADVFPSSKWIHVIDRMKPKFQKLHSEADRILGDILEKHQKNRIEKMVVHGDIDDAATISHEYLVDVLLKFMEHDDIGFSLTLDNIKAVIFDMFVGGSETAATAVSWAMAEMMKNPTILNKAQNKVRHQFATKGKVEEDGLPQLTYLLLVIKETLRLHPPLVMLIPRESKEQCEISGFEIPSKTRVIINAWSIGRDPKYWKEPEKFDPDRFLDSSIDFKGTNFEYIPFGAGRRMCPGVVFGITNIEYQLAVLLYHFNWNLPNNVELDMTEEFGATVFIKNGLFLVPSLHHPHH